MKFKIRSRIVKLPNRINFLLMKLNRYMGLFQDKNALKYKQFVKDNITKYDNIPSLIKIVNHAIETTPYYNKKYNKINNIKEFQEQFQFIDKNIISENHEDFIASDIDKSNYIIMTTGGTGGKPFKMYIPQDHYDIEVGTMAVLWENVGFNNDLRAVIRHNKIADDVEYILNPITKEIIFDGFRLNHEYFQTIYRVIKKFNVSYIHAYPSNAYEFSKFIVKNKLDFTFVKSFLSGSENAYNYQKSFIRKKTGVKFYNWYGHSEKLVLGGFCKNSDTYHIEPTYGYFELIDKKGKIINTPGEVGEIVGTTLHNKGMPMIRYKTDDFAEYVGDYCEHCQRHVTLIKNIQGRRSGLKIYSADGKKTTISILFLHDNYDLTRHLAGWQYVQKEKGKLDVLVVKGNTFKEDHDKQLKEYFKSKFSDMLITIKYVNKLIRMPNGKFVELISEIKE